MKKTKTSDPRKVFPYNIPVAFFYIKAVPVTLSKKISLEML
jgi:hypothetical protein